MGSCLIILFSPVAVTVVFVRSKASFNPCASDEVVMRVVVIGGIF